MLTTVLISLIYCAACVLVYFYIGKKENRPLNRIAVFALLFAAVAVRVFFALQDYCFTYDISCFKAWGSYANALGFKNLYGGDFFLDYPPGYFSRA